MLYSTKPVPVGKAEADTTKVITLPPGAKDVNSGKRVVLWLVKPDNTNPRVPLKSGLTKEAVGTVAVHNLLPAAEAE